MNKEDLRAEAVELLAKGNAALADEIGRLFDELWDKLSNVPLKKGSDVPLSLTCDGSTLTTSKDDSITIKTLHLEPVGKEWDSEFKPIEELSYKAKPERKQQIVLPRSEVQEVSNITVNGLPLNVIGTYSDNGKGKSRLISLDEYKAIIECDEPTIVKAPAGEAS